MVRWIICLFTTVLSAIAQPADGNWPQFRGRQANGIAEGQTLPVRWDVKTGENIKWRVAVPGLWVSPAPSFGGDRLFLTTAVSEADKGDLRLGLYGDVAPVDDESEHSWKVLCYRKSSGELLWGREVHRGVPKVKRHTKSSHANSTLATDGEKLIAFFGSEGLYCLDITGKLLWTKNFGALDAGYFKIPEAQWEFGNSPVVHSGHAIVLADVQANGFLASYRLSDGKQVWRVRRSDVPTWGTPLVVSTADRTQVVVNGFKHAGGYDFETGKELWRVEGGGDIPVPTPVSGHGLFYITNSHGGLAPLYAVNHEYRGVVKLTNERSAGLEWIARRLGSYMQTPLLYGDLLYLPRWNGTMSCLRSRTGEIVYRQRLSPGAFTASPVGGDGKIYIGSEEGEVHVVAAGEAYQLLATNLLNEPLLATPAISQGVLFFRTAKSLIAVE